MADARGSRPDAWLQRRTAVAALLAAGAAFALYPAIRPFSDTQSLRGAATAFASPAWTAAHVLGIIGFALLPLGLIGLQARLAGGRGAAPAAVAVILAVLGVGLTLPYYGAEDFGLRALGREALDRDDVSLAALADAVRYGPGAVLFGIGLLLLAFSAVLTARAVWLSCVMPRWSGAPFALAFALYIPQFWGDQPVRVAHGALTAIGCAWLALAIHRSTTPALSPPTDLIDSQDGPPASPTSS